MQTPYKNGMGDIKVSIIMPVYNSEVYLKNTLDSIKNQSFKEYELIAINDGSTDMSSKILDKYCNVINNMRVITKKNEGVSVARNIGIKNAVGKYICFLDSDDMVDIDYLEILYRISEEKQASLTVCDYTAFYGEKCEFVQEKKERVKEVDLYKKYKLNAFDFMLERGIGISAANKLIRRELIEKYNIEFNVQSSYGEDMFFCWKVCLVAESIIYIDRKLYGYRQNIYGTTMKYHENLYEKYLDEYKKLEEFARKNKKDLKILQKSIQENKMKRVPTYLRMNARRKASLKEKYKYIVELTKKNDLQMAIIEGEKMNNHKNKLYDLLEKKKCFSLFLYGYYLEYRFSFGRKIKTWKVNR